MNCKRIDNIVFIRFYPWMVKSFVKFVIGKEDCFEDEVVRIEEYFLL